MNPTPPASNPSHADLCARLCRCIEATRALRVLRWSLEWPAGHSERPATPVWVRRFEAAHGAAPASAERVLAVIITP
jgi:hypothetical protein